MISKYLSLKFFIAFAVVAFLEVFIGIFVLLGRVPDLSNPAVQKMIGVSVVLGTILNMIIYYFLVGFRLQDISGEIKNLFRGKKYSKVDAFSPDAVGDMGRFFNEMTLQIETIAKDINKAERLSGEIGLAAKIQTDVIPKSSVPVQGLETVARTKSAAEMGGDSFDIIPGNDQTFFYVGDVTGHGVPAGIIMMMVNILIRAFAPLYRKSDDILKKVNAILQPRIANNMFMTLVMLRWVHNDQKMYFTGCGHEYILHYDDSTGKCNVIKSGGIALGMIPDIEKLTAEKEIDFREGDAIVLYTDGITEAIGRNGEMYGLERIAAVVEKYGKRATADSIFENITEDFSDYVGRYAEQNDDITLIVIKNRGHLYKQESVNLHVSTAGRFADPSGENWSWE